MKRLLIILLVCLSVWACSNDQTMLEKIDGKWLYDARATWEFKNPGKEYVSTEALDSQSGFLIFDTRNLIVEEHYSPESIDKHRYLIDYSSKDKAQLRYGGFTFEFSITPKGKLLVCSPKGGADNCDVLSRNVQ